MNVDLLPIINNQNEKLSFEGVLDFQYDDAKIQAEVNGYVINFAGSLEVYGTVCAKITAPCARCLEDTNSTIDVEIKETVGKDEVELDGTILNIDDIVFGNVLINMPSRFLCSEDCLGLCSKCGSNLNINQCQCEPDDIIDERFLKPKYPKKK